MKAKDAYDKATFYTCGDPECLELESPEEAIEEYLEERRTYSGSILSLIRVHAPIMVKAFDPDQVTDSFVQSAAEDCLERAIESFGETYGGPDGESTEDLETEAWLPLMSAVLRRFYADTTPWTCHKVGEHTYTAKQVESLMREHKPEWFESESTT